MAIQPITGSAISAFPATPPMPAVARILARFEREQLAGFIAVALDLIDTLDGDPDLENATDLEDDFALSPQARGYADGPGCPVADAAENAWVEWDRMRGAQKSGHNLTFGDEDAEEDDGDGDCTDDEPAFDKRSRAIANMLWGGGPGCSIADPGGGDEGI